MHACISTYAVGIDFGKHDAVVPTENLLKLVMLVNITSLFTLMAAACSKTSITLTLLRLTDGWPKRIVWGIVATINLVLLVDATLPFSGCNPIKAAWNPAVSGSCLDISITIHFSIFAGVYSAAMDWALVLVAWAVILGLNMRIKEKIGVAICMSLGFM